MSRQSREQLEDDNRRLCNDLEIARAQLQLVAQFTRGQLEMHQPYAHANDLDLSCADPEKLKETLAAKLTRNLWCARCSNPWPCRHIDSLRLLRDLTRRYSAIGDLQELAKRMNELPRPERREGQLEVHL